LVHDWLTPLLFHVFAVWTPMSLECLPFPAVLVQPLHVFALTMPSALDPDQNCVGLEVVTVFVSVPD